MADALTTPVAACMAVGASGVALASCLSSIDLNAVICAFGGACVFILWARDISIWQRLGYLIAGWIAGYYISAELVAKDWYWFTTSGLSSFIWGLLSVSVCISVLESMETGELPKWVKLLPGVIAKYLKRDAG